MVLVVWSVLLVKHNHRQLLNEPYCPAALSCERNGVEDWEGDVGVCVCGGAVVVI